MIKFAFYGRVSTEDQQDPAASRGWQLRRATQLIEPHGGVIVAEYFDIGQSRSIPWKRRPAAARLLDAVAAADCEFSAVVIGEPQRAFYGNQFGLTFPYLTHYGVSLWVPEVGGQVDPGSEAHDMVMTLFAGMSKGERTRIQLRVRTAMTDLAANTDRFLGGRPPYGYQLVDAGPHPNPGKAAAGMRAHRMEPDPITAPVVERIFRMYAAGLGLRQIAQDLTDDGVPSPAAYDRRRNPHRDPIGWSHAAIRAILNNPSYSGRRVWNKQHKVESLIDPRDVAAGHQTTMRWRDPGDWIEPKHDTHAALVDGELYSAVRSRLAIPAESGVSRRPRQSRQSSHVYQLSGLLFCGRCEHRMSGTFRESKRKDGTGRILYRCETGKRRSLPPELADHQATLYIRENQITPALDAWIASLASAEVIAEVQEPDPTTLARTGELRAQLAELDRKIAALVAAIEAGSPPRELVAALTARSAERDRLSARVRAAASCNAPLTRDQIASMVDELGGMAAVLESTDAAGRAELYRSLGLKLTYFAERSTVRASVDLGVSLRSVRGGT